MSEFKISGRNFAYDGKPVRILSGAIHYFRVVPEYWRDRLLKLKACGLNTVETYVAWNMHEPEPGQFCFEGMADIARFVEIAGELGLFVIVRPGPYCLPGCWRIPISAFAAMTDPGWKRWTASTTN